MDRSWQKSCAPERGDHMYRPLGFHGLESREDQRKDVANSTLLFRSPSYVSGADDSGFYEAGMHNDTEDCETFFVRKPGCLAFTPDSVCSTPNRDTSLDQSFPLLEEPSASPINVPANSADASFIQVSFRKTKWPETEPKTRQCRAQTPCVQQVTHGCSGEQLRTMRFSAATHMPESNIFRLERFISPHTVSLDSAETKGNHSALVSILQSAPLNAGTHRPTEAVQHSNIGARPKQVLLQDLCNVQTSNMHGITSFAFHELQDSCHFQPLKSSTSLTSDFRDQWVKTSNDSVTMQYSDISDAEAPVRTDINNNSDHETNKALVNDENCYVEKHENFRDNQNNVSFPVLTKKTSYIRQADKFVNNSCTGRNKSVLKKKHRLSEQTELSSCASELSLASETSSEELPEDTPNPPAVPLRHNRKSCRKSTNPKRGIWRSDSKFRGATIWIQTEFKDGISNLQISAFYSNIRPGRRRLDSTSGGCYATPYSQSETEDSPPVSSRDVISVKICASCKTRRTPLWRDSEDGTPLCNACGIRYKKYRLRCSRCWHIPKKDVKTYPNCPLCGALLRYSFHKKPQGW